ncbi:MAG: LacI family DNA-binding transcriptional regulator [Chitinophagaceae bacterium]|jgi:LacI family transcriptional regulator|nr:LacI family DNA-binding transcriptional regulator [Chitinophagaceae bacterium]OQY95272.1 MAG: transcriptional regulator [Sphingobacteriales bacterium UTBCD1]
MAKKKTILSGVKEIARRAKVSIGTVDRVIHDRNGVSPETKKKIQRIIKEMDYQPNLLGRRLATHNKVTTFATLIPEISSETSFWEAPLLGIKRAEDEIRQYNVKIEKYFYDLNEKDSFVKAAKRVLRAKPEGVLIAPSFIDETIDFTNRCKELNIPYVFIDSDIPNQSSLSYIGPELYRSGYSSANLISYLIRSDEGILIVNISKQIETDHHLLRKEDGFRGFFKENNLKNEISKIDITKVKYEEIKKQLDTIFLKKKNIRLIFVTNSRVSYVARYVKENHKNVILIGYDFLDENIKYLAEGVINFLICQKPGEQAYKGIMALYRHVILKLPVEEYMYMPIDVIMKTNYSFYRN